MAEPQTTSEPLRPPISSEPLSPMGAADLLNRMDEASDSSQEPVEARKPEVAPEAPEVPSPPPEATGETPEDTDTPDSGEKPEVASSEETPSDETENPEADSADEDLPPITPPSSLSREDREKFHSLPREVQESWSEHEETRSREIRRLQSETDQEKRALSAELKNLSDARLQYEQALPQVLGMLNNEMTTKFADIRTWDDVQRMRAANPNRYLEWDSLQKQTQAIQQDAQTAQQQQTAEAQQNFSRYVQEQDAKFLEAAPEWADEKTAEKLQKQAVEVLEDVGFSQEDIQAAWIGGQPLSIRDSRVQLLIRDAVRWRAGQKAAARAKAKPAPQSVTRPGVSPQKGERESAQAKDLHEKLLKSGRAEDAVAILAARQG